MSPRFVQPHGGSLCVTLARLPLKFPLLVATVRNPLSSVQVIFCAPARHDRHPFLIRPVPILVPPLSTRLNELPRIIAEYAADALATLGADASGFTDADQAWVLDHAAETLPAIETATLRLVAFRFAGTVTGAAKLLGTSHVALSRWFKRRRARGRGKATP